MGIGLSQDNGAQPTQLGMQQTRGAIAGLGPKGIATYQFGQMFCVMGWTLAVGPHLIQSDRHPCLGNLPGGFCARQSAANDLNWLHVSVRQSGDGWCGLLDQAFCQQKSPSFQHKRLGLVRSGCAIAISAESSTQTGLTPQYN
jgi:hypothetical protein